MGQDLFAKVESGRQNYIYASYSFPYITAGVGIVLFFAFACISPMKSTLYKETTFGFVVGGLGAYANLRYYRNMYLTEVNDAYFILTQRMKERPDLYKLVDDDSVAKNFGTNKFNDDTDFDPDIYEVDA